MDADRQAALNRWLKRCKPLPKQNVRLPFERTFTAAQWEQIERGLIPRRMEQKWVIFVEDNTIHFHRSWSGYCVYQVSVKPSGTGWAAESVLVNREAAQYRSPSDAYDLSLLDVLISNFLLREAKAFPLPPDAPNTIPGLFQHHVAGSGYAEVRLPDDQ